MYRRLYIWIEGPDDQRFFERVVQPLFEETYSWVGLVPYASLRKEKVRGFLNGIRKMSDADYIFTADADATRSVGQRKRQVLARYNSVDEERLLIVVKEIESWYLAGLDSGSCATLGIPHHTSTDDIAKEGFEALIPRRFSSKIDFCLQILGCFALSVALKKNASFKYFVETFVGVPDPPPP